MRRRLAGLRLRVAAHLAASFALLLAIGGAALYAWLARDYRADFDRTLGLTMDAAERLYRHDLPEYGTPLATVTHVLTELVFPDRTIVAVDWLGHRLAATLPYAGAPVLDDLDHRMRAPVPVTVGMREGHMRIVRAELGDGVALLVAMPLAPLEARLARLRTGLLVGLPLVILLGVALGVATSRRALQPVMALADAADRLGEEVAGGAARFSPIAPSDAGDELARLAAALQRLSERLAAALRQEREVAEQQRAFLADAAHELRTPVAIIRGAAETSLAADADPARHREALAGIVEEAGALGQLVGDLLALARATTPAGRAEWSDVYLDDLAHRVIARLRALPSAAGRDIRFGDFAEAPVRGNPALLERAVLALVHNALVHAAPSPVELAAGMHAGRAWLRVRDWGPGIPDGDDARIFERFERLDDSRPGSGLGLAIARQIAAAHGGTVTLERPADGGAAFVLALPAA